MVYVGPEEEDDFMLCNMAVHAISMAGHSLTLILDKGYVRHTLRARRLYWSDHFSGTVTSFLLTGTSR